MTAIVDQDYEFEERAATREYYGRPPRGTANSFARQEVESREQTDEYQKLTPEEKIKALRDRRVLVGRQLRAETDPEMKDKLFSEWQDLFTQIIELRKELKNGNDGRLSGRGRY